MGRKGKYAYLAKNTLLFTSTQFGSKILSFFLVPLYTAVLSTSDYGTADLVNTTASLLVYAFTINISDSVLRFAIEKEEEQEKFLGFGLKVLFIGSAILAVGIWGFRCLNLIEWDDYVYFFLFLTFYFSALNGILSNYLRAIDKVVAVAVSGIITTTAVIVCNLLFLLVFRIGVVGYMLSSILGYVASIFYSFFVLRKRLGLLFRDRCNRQIKKAMCAYSIPLIFNGVAWWMNSSIDKYFLTAMMCVDVNGIYAVSQKIPSILSMCSAIFSQAWNLSAIKEFDKDDRDGFFKNTYNMYNSALTIACSVLILINIPLAKILFSNDFFEAWKYSSPLLISMVFSSMSSFIGSVFSAVKNNKVFAVSTVAAATVNIGLNAAIIPLMGAFGAAIATAVSFFVVWLIRLVCSKRYIHMNINLFVDFSVYALLCLQVMFEHQANHFYVGQFIVFIVILFLYRKTLLKVINMVRSIGKKTKNRDK